MGRISLTREEMDRVRHNASFALDDLADRETQYEDIVPLVHVDARLLINILDAAEFYLGWREHFLKDL